MGGGLGGQQAAEGLTEGHHPAAARLGNHHARGEDVVTVSRHRGALGLTQAKGNLGFQPPQLLTEK